mgnify:CR=1 FL=1
MELKGIEYFRKGTELRKINEDPTLLSFFMLFNVGDAGNSPLLHPTGGAMHYLKNIIGGTEGDKYAESLANFQKLLIKINREMPWFWQELSGLETTQTYNKMEDPYWGKDNKIEITCLEENVELMGNTLMKLYRDACFDYQRWVEVIPERLRIFSVDIFVTEVRTFQQTISARETDLFGQQPSNSDLKDDGYVIAPALAADVKPFIHVQLGRCLFDMESGKEMLAELNKNPDMKKSKIAFSYSTVKNPSYQPGLHLGVREEELNIPPKKTAAPNAYNPATDVSGAEPAEEGKKSSPLGDKVKSKMAKLKDRATGVVSQVTNITDGIGMGGSLGNAHGALLGGPLANVVNSAVENVTGKLFLDNVYGVNPLGTVQDAINAGSINGLINAAGQVAKGIKSSAKPKGETPISPDKVYGAATPDSNSPINESVYDKIAPDNDDLGKSSVYDKTPGGDSTLTKENVYGNTAPDNDDLGKSSVYDKPAANNDTLTKDNVYE